MGEVYNARDTRLDRLVAVKVLPSDKVADADRKRRFIEESNAASGIYFVRRTLFGSHSTIHFTTRIGTNGG